MYGVEIVPQAIEDAKRNAEQNQIHNASFEAGKAEEVIPVWYEQGRRADVVVVDPPRKGCDSNVIKTIIDIKPNKLIYVSCEPSTLARDVKIFCENGFHVEGVQVFDQFPMTVHTECCVKLERKSE